MLLNDFFSTQLLSWPLAADNYHALGGVRLRRLDYCKYGILVQFNPARIVSSGAKTDAASIASRPCFLCASNRPAGQKSLPTGDFELLVNPFPIFKPHFTIAHRDHTPQLLLPYIDRWLAMSAMMTGMALFYNGARCGASAPDHAHFQACSAKSLPIVNDYFAMRCMHTTMLEHYGTVEIRTIDGYLRHVICIESDRAAEAAEAVVRIMARLAATDTNQASALNSDCEPMLNAVSLYADRRHYVWLFPRKAFRPWQYSADEPQRLIISPATVEMAGLMITPVEDHFNRVNKADIEDIYHQCSAGLEYLF